MYSVVLRDRCWHIVPNALVLTENNGDDSECLFLCKFQKKRVKLSRYTPSRDGGEADV
jgi:hypothetical protein